MLAKSHQIIIIALLLCCAGASYLPVMALFGATATKDTLYDYTVKDAGEPILTPNLLEASPDDVWLQFLRLSFQATMPVAMLPEGPPCMHLATCSCCMQMGGT